LAGTKQSPALSASSQTVKGIASFRKLVSGQAIPPYNDKRLVIAIAKAITPARQLRGTKQSAVAILGFMQWLKLSNEIIIIFM
jgi:hypothetical protein